jgi:hypothetical protein
MIDETWYLIIAVGVVAVVLLVPEIIVRGLESITRRAKK